MSGNSIKDYFFTSKKDGRIMKKMRDKLYLKYIIEQFMKNPNKSGVCA